MESIIENPIEIEVEEKTIEFETEEPIQNELYKNYFAAKPTSEIGQELKKKVDDYYNFVKSNKISNIWQRSYDQYHAGYFNIGMLQTAGEEGELTKINVNHYRNLIQHTLSLTSQQRMYFEPKAVNTDYISLAQTVVARGLLEFYLRNKGMETNMSTTEENAVVYGEGYLYQRWNPKLEDGKGDVETYTLTPADVIRDTNMRSIEGHQWYIITRYCNKYEIAAEYPKYSQDIVNMSSSVLQEYSSLFFDNMVRTNDGDIIPVYTLIHKKSAAIPDGRLVSFMEDGLVVEDRELPYEEFPLSSVIISSIKGTSFGYPIMLDLLSIQQAYNGTASSIVSAHNAFGIQNVLLPKGSDIDLVHLTSGMNGLPYDPAAGKPEVLQLLQIPAEQYNFLNWIEKMMETLSGINSTVRGNPEASLKSGAALALVSSMSIQFGSQFQKVRTKFAEDTGTSLVSILKKYANEPRIIAISGRSNRSSLKEFSAKDISNITRVYVDFGNPIQKTIAGRVNMAEQWLTAGLIKTPDEYLSVIETGRYEPLIEGDRNQFLLIKSENESLMDGTEVIAIATDRHPLHIQEHASILSSPDIRQNTELVTNTLQHINEHINLIKQTDPDLLMMLGMQPIMQQPPMMNGIEGSPMGNSEIQTMPQEGQPQIEGLPSMPTNPMTGKKFDNKTGGLS